MNQNYMYNVVYMCYCIFQWLEWQKDFHQLLDIICWGGGGAVGLTGIWGTPRWGAGRWYEQKGRWGRHLNLRWVKRHDFLLSSFVFHAPLLKFLFYSPHGTFFLDYCIPVSSFYLPSFGSLSSFFISSFSSSFSLCSFLDFSSSSLLLSCSLSLTHYSPITWLS